MGFNIILVLLVCVKTIQYLAILLLSNNFS